MSMREVVSSAGGASAGSAAPRANDEDTNSDAMDMDEDAAASDKQALAGQVDADAPSAASVGAQTMVCKDDDKEEEKKE